MDEHAQYVRVRCAYKCCVALAKRRNKLVDVNCRRVCSTRAIDTHANARHFYRARIVTTVHDNESHSRNILVHIICGLVGRVGDGRTVPTTTCQRVANGHMELSTKYAVTISELFTDHI
jgi:hypothetical protein